MKIIFVFAGFLLLFALTTDTTAGFIVNSGFETGDATGWMKRRRAI